MTNAVAIRPARKSDAADMALLVNIAGHGLPSYVWAQSDMMAEVDSAFEIGRLRAMREDGSFSWRNALLAASDDEVAGMLVGYRQPYEIELEDTSEMNPIFKPLVELEAEAPGTWYLNILAVFSNWRGKGVGGMLIRAADECATREKAKGLSLIAADDNASALRFYERQGFQRRAERPVVPYPGGPQAGHWLLMMKE